MKTRTALAIAAMLSLARGARADEPAPAPQPAPQPVPQSVPQSVPIFAGSSATKAAAPARQELLVFSGTQLLNEFVYRAILKLPPDATATPFIAKTVAAELAAFLGEAGYDLAKVRTQVKGDRIEVQIDEGALDKIIFIGTGWLTALRFRAALNLPLDVFNRRLFDLQMPRLAKQFGMRGYKYELWPVHAIDTDNAVQLDDVEELRAMPLIRSARGYELRILAVNEPWGTGFSPEILLNGSIGIGAGGRYRWKDLLQDGDRWQVHFRLGGASRTHLDPEGGTYYVNSLDALTTRWLSKPWDGSSRGLRMTIAPRAELWTLQRRDLMVERYRIGTLELGSGAGAQLAPEFALYFTLGFQRRWINSEPPRGGALLEEVTKVPGVSSRGFLRMSSQYTSNPTELRQDMRNGLTLELNAFRPAVGDRGYFHLELGARKLISFGWHELRLGGRISGEFGDVWYVDEIGLGDHLRIGFGLDKYTQRVASFSFEFRYSLLRDKVKLGVYNDLGVWRHLPRDDPRQAPEVAGSTGVGLFLFAFDELQFDIYYGAGWSLDNPMRSGIALAIKEAF